MSEKQQTISNPVTIKGKGLHSGIDVTLTFKPAPENHGCVFQRIDLDNKPLIPAHIKYVSDTSRGTSLGIGEAKVGTIEHVLSAIYGIGIDNILIEMNGPEVPILDGSAQPFINALLESKIVRQEAKKKYFTLSQNIEYINPEKQVEICAFPDNKLSIDVLIDYDSCLLANQYASIHDLSIYQKEIASCRTFVFLRELERLQNENLIKGGGMENAIVLVDKPTTQEELDRLADLFNKPRVKIKPQGVLNNIELRYNNEPARHKLLDFIGDLSLCGVPLKAKILAKRPGHLSNIEFVKILYNVIRKEHSKTPVPQIDLNAPPLMDIMKIKKLLPHRPPFLFVDKVLKMDSNSVIGIKNVTMTEDYFVGHFPEHPVMPGVLQIEAMAQVGGILVLNSVPDPENYLTYFMKIENVKFRKQVYPGDTLILQAVLTAPIRRGIAKMLGTAYVGDSIATEAEMMAQISKKI